MIDLLCLINVLVVYDWHRELSGLYLDMAIYHSIFTLYTFVITATSQ